MLNDFGLPHDVFEDVLDTIRSYSEIKSAKIFGSRAKGNYKRYSDVDIAIFSDTGTDLSSCIKDKLEDLDAIYYFDVLDYNKVSDTKIKEHIDRVGIEILAGSAKNT